MKKKYIRTVLLHIILLLVFITVYETSFLLCRKHCGIRGRKDGIQEQWLRNAPSDLNAYLYCVTNKERLRDEQKIRLSTGMQYWRISEILSAIDKSGLPPEQIAIKSGLDSLRTKAFIEDVRYAKERQEVRWRK